MNIKAGSILHLPSLKARCAFLALAIFYLLGPIISGSLYHPPEVGDGHDYDMLAYSLSEGDGFANNWSARAWRAPYELFVVDDRFTDLLTRQGDVEITTYRPPGLPVLLAVIYEIFGREFWIWRIAGALLAAGAYAIAAGLSNKIAGPIAGWLCLLFALNDELFTSYAPTFMTETCTALALIWAAGILFFDSGSPWPARARSKIICAGLALGLAAALRSAALPLVGCMLLAAYFTGVSAFKGRVVSILVAAIIVSAVLSPWVIYNSRSTAGQFPLGTQWPINVPDGFSDEALQTGGLWTTIATSRVEQAMDSAEEQKLESLTPAQREVARATYNRSQAVLWIQAHLSDMPLLAARKLQALWYIHANLFQVSLAFLALVAIFLVRNRGLMGLLSAVFIGQSLIVVMSWVVPNGRFLIPLHPMLAVAAAAGLVGFYRMASRWRRASPNFIETNNN